MAQPTMATVEPEEVEGHFASQKKRTVKSMKVKMAERPSTTATPSNQFIVKCSVRGHHVYKRIWGPCVGEQFETFCEEDKVTRQVCRGCTSVQLFNCSRTHSEGNNTHMPLLHQEAEDDSAAQV